MIGAIDKLDKDAAGNEVHFKDSDGYEGWTEYEYYTERELKLESDNGQSVKKRDDSGLSW